MIGRVLVMGRITAWTGASHSGKFAGKMFHQNAEEPPTQIDHPVDHDGPVFVVVLALVSEIKPFRQRHIQPYGAALTGPS